MKPNTISELLIVSSSKKIKQAVIDLKFQEIGGMVQEALNDGISALRIIDALSAGLEVVGDLYAKREYFLSDLYMGAETMLEAMKIVEPRLRVTKAKLGASGKVVIGSVLGDAHDFGKRIAKALLIAYGFEVYDIGVDVPAEKFAIEVEKYDADVVGLSTILTSAHTQVPLVVKELEKRGLRDKVKIIQGGTTVTIDCVKRYGIDAAVNSAVDGCHIIKHWIEENSKKRRNKG